MQFQADVLGVPVVRPQVTETTALGAAYLAGLATGFWAGPEELKAKREGDVRFEPRMDTDEREARRRVWQKAVGAGQGLDGIEAANSCQLKAANLKWSWRCDGKRWCATDQGAG
jgi:glycerol kinase